MLFCVSVFYFFVLPGMDVSQFDDPVTFLSYVCVGSVQILRAALFFLKSLPVNESSAFWLFRQLGLKLGCSETPWEFY